MAEPEPGVWGQATQITGDQAKGMYPEALALSLRMAVEKAEHKAREFGIEEPRVRVMFLTEFVYPPEDEESD